MMVLTIMETGKIMVIESILCGIFGFAAVFSFLFYVVEIGRRSRLEEELKELGKMSYQDFVKWQKKQEKRWQ